MKIIKVKIGDSQVPVDIKNVKKGEYFTLKDIPEPKESQVYVAEGYDRSEKQYSAYKFSDISSGKWLKPGTKVFVDFTF